MAIQVWDHRAEYDEKREDILAAVDSDARKDRIGRRIDVVELIGDAVAMREPVGRVAGAVVSLIGTPRCALNLENISGSIHPVRIS